MSVNQYIQENQDRFLNELFDLLRIPSISADPAYAGDVRRCAETVAEHLKKVGADNVVLEETAGYPIVYGEKIIDASLPTVLVIFRSLARWLFTVRVSAPAEVRPASASASDLVKSMSRAL